MSLITQIHDIAASIATEFKALKSKISGNTSGDLGGLSTTAKTSMVDSVNELKATLNGKQPLIGFTPQDISMKGAPNGYASLDANAKVPANQLPSFVDDVEEYDSYIYFPETGRADCIYMDFFDKQIYRWSGTGYVQISQNIALGFTSATAIRGDYGKAGYDHSQVSGANPHNLTYALLSQRPMLIADAGITDCEIKVNIGGVNTNFVTAFESALV
jgi:hypothetical protein